MSHRITIFTTLTLLCMATAQCGGVKAKPDLAGQATRSPASKQLAAMATAEATAWSAAGESGFRPSRATISIDAENSRWMNYLSVMPSVLDHPGLREKLGTEDYWVAYFSYKKPSNRELWVFVSGDGQRVLDVLHGR